MSDNEIIDALRDSLLGYDVLTSDEIEIKLGKISDKIITQSSDLARLRELLGEVELNAANMAKQIEEHGKTDFTFMGHVLEYRKLSWRIQSELKE